MGLFTSLVTLPLAPVRGVVWIAEQIAEEAERTRNDEDDIRRRLIGLELDYEDGTISEEERSATERELMQRLSTDRDSLD
ncbi:MAG: gas vesicle protein GvpG [Solirubrobacteraceae bacterium]